VSLTVAAPAALDAASESASLRIGVQVTRRCTVTTGASPVVRCTRMPGAPAEPLLHTGKRPVLPLRSTMPSTSGTQVVTVLF
jgi:hypothetical protein